MKVTYKGHDIDVTRERSMMGETLLYYGVFRQSDGREITSGFSYSSETVREFVKLLKGMIDREDQ